MAIFIPPSDAEYPMKGSSRTCAQCKYSSICILKIQLDQNLKHAKINIREATVFTPKTIEDVHEVIAEACYHFKSYLE